MLWSQKKNVVHENLEKFSSSLHSGSYGYYVVNFNQSVSVMVWSRRYFWTRNSAPALALWRPKFSKWCVGIYTKFFQKYIFPYNFCIRFAGVSTILPSEPSLFKREKKQHLSWKVDNWMSLLNHTSPNCKILLETQKNEYFLIIAYRKYRIYSKIFIWT